MQTQNMSLKPEFVLLQPSLMTSIKVMEWEGGGHRWEIIPLTAPYVALPNNDNMKKSSDRPGRVQIRGLSVVAMIYKPSQDLSRWFLII